MFQKERLKKYAPTNCGNSCSHKFVAIGFDGLGGPVDLWECTARSHKLVRLHLSISKWENVFLQRLWEMWEQALTQNTCELSFL